MPEPDAYQYAVAIRKDPVRLMSVGSLLETAIVSEHRFGLEGSTQLDQFLREANIEVVEVTREQADWGRIGFRRYGRGRHPANLNYGDCLTYALAKASDEPVLFKGNNFHLTDLQCVSLPEIEK